MKKDTLSTPDYKGASYDEIQVNLGKFQCFKKPYVNGLFCFFALTLVWFIIGNGMKAFLEQSAPSLFSLERMFLFSLLTTVLSGMVFYIHTLLHHRLSNFQLVRLFSKQSLQKQKSKASKKSRRKP